MNYLKNYLWPDKKKYQKRWSRQILSRMKLIIITLMIGIISIHAEVFSQAYSLSFKNKPLREVIRDIEKQGDFRFFFSDDVADLNRLVQVNVANASIDQLLSQLLTPYGLDYQILEDNLIVISPYSSVMQGVVISGTVTDATGEPLPGVTVMVKGTTQGTATDANGAYSLQIPNENTTLVFSFIGFAAQEMVVGNRRSINVILTEDSRQLEEVVVIGYGTASTKKLTTSVARMDAQKLADLPITNVADAFTGNISGVMIEQGSGAPGALPVIRVRGYGSINAGSEPLYVIDGMIVTVHEFSILNPKSVESVNVLKDAAAGAIYGSRASNGVVIVTTKEGKGKAKISYNSTMGLQYAERTVPVLSVAEYIEYSKLAYANSGQPEPVFSPDIANTNWQDQIFRNGFFQNHQLSASGSYEMINYHVTANYIGDEGIILNTYKNTFSSNGNFNIQLNKKVKFGLTYNAAYIKQRANAKVAGQAGFSSGILETAVIQYPVVPVYMPNGDYAQPITKEWGSPVSYNFGNPVAPLNEVRDLSNWFSGIGRAFINYEPIEKLNINLSFNGLIDSTMDDYYESPYLSSYGHNDLSNFSNPIYRDMRASQGNSTRLSRTVEGFIDYKFSIDNKHNFGIIGGFSNEYNLTRSTSATASINDRGANAENPLPRFDNDLRPNIWGAYDVTGTGSFSEFTFQSLFARLNYDLDSKYLFMASLRRDGSSKFAPGNRYGVFPAASAAWRVTQESFMENQHFFDELKFRVSYGISGNDQIGNYAWQGRAGYGTPQYIFSPNTPPAITEYPSSIENRKLKWETNEQLNLGFDFEILNSRIQLVSDFYIRNTTDMILNKPLPSVNGISGSMLDNIGNMTNKGIEILLTTTNIKRDNFIWTTNWIFNKVWNKATKIYSADGIIRMGSGMQSAIWIKEGEEMFQIYGYKILGCFETEEDLNKYPRVANAKIGDPITEDYNNDGIINSDDLQKLGHALPNFTFGWTNTFSYKDFDLNIVMDGSQGASKWMAAFDTQGWVSPYEGNLARYIYERAGKSFGAPSLDYTGGRNRQNSYFVVDASYIRIKNVTLGYQIPKNICETFNISALRFSLGIQNLYTFTTYPWFNPQSNYYGGNAGQAQFGVDFGSYPLATSYSLGINLTF